MRIEFWLGRAGSGYLVGLRAADGNDKTNPCPVPKPKGFDLIGNGYGTASQVLTLNPAITPPATPPHRVVSCSASWVGPCQTAKLLARNLPFDTGRTRSLFVWVLLESGPGTNPRTKQLHPIRYSLGPFSTVCVSRKTGAA